jgi:ABC-type sugar transport system substrate-binding protein
MRDYVHDGTVKTVILWNPVDLGYLTVYAARALCDGTLKRSTRFISAGRLGKREVRGDEVLLGPPMKFTKANIDRYDF